MAAKVMVRALAKAMHFLLALSLMLENAVSGEEYFLVFMEQYFSGDPYLKLAVSVSNPTSSAVKSTINFVNIQDQNVTLKLAPGESYTVDVSQDAILNGSVKHDKHLHINSSRHVAVYASTDFAYRYYAAVGFMVLPVSSLTSQYLVATHCDSSKCIFAVTSAEDANELTVHLRMTTGQAMYEGNAFSDNDTIQESLNKGETMQVTCEQCDMTGTLVTATKHIAVFSGGEFTRISSIRTAHRDAVAEQMVPVEALGDRYTLLANHTNPTLQLIVKIVLIKAGDQCIVDGKCYTAARDRDVFIFSGHTANISEIVASGRLFVCQIIFTNKNFGSGISLSLPPPRHQWKTDYEIYIPRLSHGLNNYENIICLLLPAVTDPAWIYVSGGNASEVQSTPGGKYTVVWYTFPTGGAYHVQCTNSACQPFSGFVINSVISRAAGYPLTDGLYLTHEADISTADAQTSLTPTCPVTLPLNVTSGYDTTTESDTTMRTSELSRQRPLCSCMHNQKPQEVHTERRLQQFTAEIKANLTEDKKKLSSYIRTKMSVADPRKSSSVLGTAFGLSIFVTFAALILLSDIVTLIGHLATSFCK